MPNTYIEPKLARTESRLIARLEHLSEAAGTHSPSLATTLQEIPEIDLVVDACFLSNPYATNLVLDYFDSELLSRKDAFRMAVEAYPSQNRAISEQFAPSIGVSPDRMFIGNGATEVIQAVIHNYASHVHLAVPTFSPYYEFAGESAVVTTFELNSDDQFILDREAYVESVKNSRADVAVLITPNNPDGRAIDSSDLSWMLEQLRVLKAVIVDESFIHFTQGVDKVKGLPTLLPIVEEFENAILVKSMAKDFGVAGLRAGYAVMDQSKVSDLLKSGYLWNSNGFAEYFYSLFSRSDFVNEYKSTLSRYRRVIDRFTARTSGLDELIANPTDANFQLIRLPDGVSADLVTSLLLIRHGVYVRSCSDKLGLNGEYIRVAIRTDKENDLVIGALQSVVDDLIA